MYKVIFAHQLTKEELLVRQLPDYPKKGERVVIGFRYYQVQDTEWHLNDGMVIWVWLQ